MIFKELGKTGQAIASIGQGTMGVGGYLLSDNSNDHAAIENIRIGIDSGLTFIDTAEVYGEGHCEELIGMAIAGIRDQVFIASKVSPENLGYEDVINSCEKSLLRLKTEYIDLYQVHWPNPVVPFTETMEAMNKLRDQGKIRFCGVSNFSLGQLKEACQAFPGMISAEQVEYNLIDRSIEGKQLSFFNEQEITVIAYSPLNQGKFRFSGAKSVTLETIAHKHGRTPAQIALAWIIRQPGIIAIPKANTPEHIRLNAEAVEIILEKDEIEAIGSAFRCEQLKVPVDQIKVVLDGQGGRKAYQTLDDALNNALDFCPSPKTLADDILRLDEAIKPVRVRKSHDTSGKYIYDLVEGRIRYWAWVIAHAGKKPITVLVHDEA